MNKSMCQSGNFIYMILSGSTQKGYFYFWYFKYILMANVLSFYKKDSVCRNFTSNKVFLQWLFLSKRSEYFFSNTWDRPYLCDPLLEGGKSAKIIK